ncbi:hypothetical protein MCOR25_000121 [Pyricularia grisea]|nr:hypothetical protein MCOR25_000121 [Pyricularia grisea]
MVNYRFATLIALAGLAAAVPLNINLGAYSPALVVGDGEISFGGGEETGKKTGAAAIASAPGAATSASAPVSNAASQQQSSQASSTTTTDAVSTPNPALEQQAQQIAALQGMGKAIAPRQEDHKGETESEDETPAVAKRDLSGFQAALNYAEKALTKGPIINLGTGKEGKAGVGIVVNNNPTTATKTTARRKRDLGVSRKVKVTTIA